MKAPVFLSIFPLALFVALGGTYAQSSPATKTSCQVLPASQVSKIIGMTVTERVMVTPSVPAGVCMYSAAGRPVLQLSVTTYDTVDLATKNFKALGMGTKLVARQKGAVIVSAITMNGDTSRLGALLDAAMHNL
jgi:hypothetical protein